MRTISTILFSLSVATLVSASEPPRENLQLWLDAANPGERVDEQGQIRIWQDLAPGGKRSAGQPDAEKRPVRESETLHDTTIHSIRFDGENDFLHMPKLQLSDGFSFFVVLVPGVQTKGGSHWRAVLSGDKDAFREESRQFSLFCSNGDHPMAFLAEAPRSLAEAPPNRIREESILPRRNPFSILNVQLNPGREPVWELRRDGILIASKVLKNFPKKDEMQAGYTLGQGGNMLAGAHSRHFRGKIAEVTLYGGGLTEKRRCEVENYLAEKYQISLPGHPPVEHLDLWLRADLHPVTDAEYDVVRQAPFPVGSARNHGGVSMKISSTDVLTRPKHTVKGAHGNPGFRFQKGDFFQFESWDASRARSVLSAVTDETGRFTILDSFPAISADNSGFAGDVHEVLAYGETLTDDALATSKRYLENRYRPSEDPRRFRNGDFIFTNGYIDQPYVVECADGTWLCVMTTNNFAETAGDFMLLTTRSTDRGKTWSHPVANIEPPTLFRPAWATLLATPTGRVFVFYNIKESRADVPGRLQYRYRYSDDFGLTWSRESGRIDLPRLAHEAKNISPNGWSVCPPIIKDGSVLLAYSRFVPPGRSTGRGFVYRSDDLLTNDTPETASWKMFPEDDNGLRRDDLDCNFQEEHIIVPLKEAGHLYCVWRTELGHPLESYSRDLGETWCKPRPMRYGKGGDLLRHPLACVMPVALGDGKYLLWFHNASGPDRGRIYRPRDVVWLAAGEERGGELVWSQPEIILFGSDLPINGTGMSYPGILPHDDGLSILTTDKMTARHFQIEEKILDGMRDQLAGRPTATPEPRFRLGEKERANWPQAPELRRDGFTVAVRFSFQSSNAEQSLFSVNDSDATPLAEIVAPKDSATLSLRLWDRRGRFAELPLADEILEPGKSYRLTWIVDGDAKIGLPVFEERQAAVAEGRDRSWLRLPDDFVWPDSSTLTVRCGTATATVFDSALRVSQAISLQRESSRSSDKP